MTSIRVLGDSPREIPRESLEWARSAAAGQAYDDAQPLCAASASHLRIEHARRAYSCAHAAASLAEGDTALDVRACWKSEARRSLTKAHADGQLPEANCASCVRDLQSKLWSTCGIVRDHATARDDGKGLRTLTCVMGPDDDPDEWATALTATLENLELLVVETENPFTCASFHAVVEMLTASDDRPALGLRLTTLPDVTEFRAALGELIVGSVQVRWSPDWRTTLSRAAALVGGDRVVFRLDVDCDNWFEIPEVAAASGDVGARLDLRSDRAAMTRLPLLEQKFLVGYLTDVWEPMTGSNRPSSVPVGAYDDLLAELRTCVRTAARDSMYDAPKRVLDGDGTLLAWPSLDHPIFDDEDRIGRLTNRFLDLRGSASARSWVEGALVDADAELLRDRACLRILAQSVAVSGKSEPAARLLRGLYADEDRRPELLAVERSFARDAHADGWLDHLHEHLGVDRFGRREPPFPFEPVAAPADSKPDVTVLVPSFRHGRYIDATLRSVLAQTYGNFKLLVVDDRSDDDTVAVAQSVEDPRIDVRVNPENLGLGNSVRAALERCDTPFVALLNSDDLFHPERLERCRQAMLDNPRAQLVATDLELVDEDGGHLTAENANRLRDGSEVYDWVGWFAHSQPEDYAPEHLFADLLSSNFLATSTNLFARTDFLIEQTESLERLKYCLDWQLFLEAARNEALVYLPEKLAAYRLHSANTVWFREGRRWTYFLEVNRVVAGTLARYLESPPRTAALDTTRQQVLEFVTERVAGNTEVDGYGMFLNTLLGGVQLDALSDTDGVRTCLESINARSERIARAVYVLRDHIVDAGDADAIHDVPSLRVAQVLSDLTTEELTSTKGRADWSEVRASSAERELGDMQSRWQRASREFGHIAELIQRLAEAIAPGDEEAIAVRDAATNPDAPLDDRVAEEVERLYAIEWRLRREVEGRANLEKTRTRLETELSAAREETEKARTNLGGQIDNLKQRVSDLDERVTTLRSKKDELLARIETVQAEKSELRGKLDAERDALRTATAQLERTTERAAATTEELDRTRAERDEMSDTLAAKTAAVESLTEQRTQLRDELTELNTTLAATRAAWRDEIEALYQTREWRTGRFLWQKLPGIRKATRFAGRVKRRVSDMRERSRLRRQSGGDRMSIVASSTSRFPIYSHTFVYQELLGFHDGMHADVHLFYREDGSPDELSPAFEFLLDRRTKIDASRDIFERDLAHYRKQAPDRVASLFEALAEHSGLSMDELEKSHELLPTFTYARRVEAVGPDYLHSYFFYDQSLNALVAQWLLDIPRGISSYADHMLDDWPLKVVPLHIRTADVIVATSRRIKQELCDIGGAEHADKILVKPNGVDGTRFPFHERLPLKNDDTLELLSISRLERKKGLLELVDAIAQLRDRGRKVRVHVVGTIEPATPANIAYGEAFERELENRGVVDAFVMHGFKRQADLAPLLTNAHAFVAPYAETAEGDKDGIPTSVLEAMSSGLPIVASDAGSLPEVIDNGVEGFLCPQQDGSALAIAIEGLFAGTERIRELGRNARARFEREFDANVTDARLHERVRDVLSRKGAPRS